MYIPKRITVAGNSITILVEELSDDDCYGYYSHRRRVIGVQKGLTPKVTRETIRHEMLHCALAFCGLSSLVNYEEESIVRCMDDIFFPAYERFLKRFSKNGKPRNHRRNDA